MCDDDCDWKIVVGVIVLAIGILLTLILVPLSFTYIPKNSIGFKRSTTSNTVDLGAVYGNGRYFWGLGYSSVTFPATLQRVALTRGDRLSVFTDSGQTLFFDTVFYYRLDPTQLGKMYTDFGSSYATRISAIARAALRNAATNNSVDSYISNRQNVSDSLYEALQSALTRQAYVILDPVGFSLQTFYLPSVTLVQKTNIFEINQLLITNQYRLIASQYRLETTQLVTSISNEATLVTQQAKQQASRILQDANSRAFQSVQSATGQQLALMITALGLSPTSNSTADLLKLNALLDSDKASLKLLSGVPSTLLTI